MNDFKRLVCVLVLFGALSSFADELVTCTVSGSNGWHNLTQASTAAMTEEECMNRAQAFFEARVEDNSSVLHPFQHTMTVKFWSVEWKKVTVTYRSADAKVRKVFKRDQAQVIQIDEKTLPVKVWKCWSQGECNL